MEQTAPPPMPKKGTPILVSKAAKIKGCTANAIRNAVERGELLMVQGIGAKAIVVNDQFINWQVREWAGRLHKKKNGNE
jgi:hypothetical protein